MAKLIQPAEIDSEALEVMRERGGDWFAYQNHALDSRAVGHLRFLQCGPGRTFEQAPARMPDTEREINWRYLLVGKVDLSSGEITPL
jgi:hypothetical protein